MMNASLPSHDQALAIFAHELREPLAAILFATHALSTSTQDECDTREMCEIVERQSRYVARLVDDVLELCRGRSDKPKLHRDWFDLKRVMAQAIEATNPLMTQRGHHLVISLPQERVYALADALRLQQIVINLLANAAKYTNPGGLIWLTVEATDELIVIEVRDNGVGIPQALLPRIFDLFRQGEEVPKGLFSGLGIDLALVKSLVELHGGGVSAHSDGVGTGSAFVVRLPRTSTPVHEGSAHRVGLAGSASDARQPIISPMCDA